ncbi:MAG: NAD(P)-dependent oxidoreductase [Halofilum sp. (in: g-proteobacteria)]|nr:NAD(P)-dependent oxidoreductase [Halofilum sp. (in: g-proteobacteria)]
MNAKARAKKVGWIGLGVMGGPMAGHLADAGHQVTVYNRTADKADAWCQRHDGAKAATPAEAAAGAELVFTCVGRDEDVRAVAEGDDGLLSQLGEGAIWVDHSTVSAALAREMAETTRAAGAGFVDAPVSGGQAGAENGKLAVMVGGDAEHVGAVEPVAQAYSARFVHIGEAGSGQLAKMVNQICIAGLLQALSEGIAFAQRAGVDVDKVLEAIGGGAAQSWQMDNRARTMAAGEFDFGFAVEWMCKDLDICVDEAGRNGAQLPVTRQVKQYYEELLRQGHGRDDTSSLIRLLRDG